MFTFLATDTLKPFFGLVLSYPTIVFSVLLFVSLIYWLCLMVGLVDLDLLGIGDVDTDIEGNTDAGGVAGVLIRLRLNGIPITIIITLISLFGWVISSTATYYLAFLLTTWITHAIFGSAILLGALYGAVLVTSVLIKPIRPAFIASNQQVQKAILGQTAIVRSGEVTTEFGEAYLNDGGAGLIVKVRPYKDQIFTRGEKIVLLEHDPITNIYKVVSETDFKS